MLRNNGRRFVHRIREEGNTPNIHAGAIRGEFTNVLPKLRVENRRRGEVLPRLRRVRCRRARRGGVEAQPDGAAAPTDEMPASGINAPANEAATEPVPAKARRSKKPLVIAAVVAALLAAGGGAGYYFGVYAPEQAREAAEQEALAAKHAVRFSVSAQGWDTSAGASRLPVHITGREERGKKVDAVRYVDSDGEGVELRRGSYKVEVAASPIATDGTVYAVPAEKPSIKLGEKADGKKAVDAGDVALEPVEASEVTDDQIAAAKKYAEKDKGAKKAGFNIDAAALATAATKRRDDAVAAKQAEEEARRQAEEEARKAEEARQARTFETDHFTMVLPDWFPMDWLEFETTSDTLTANDVKAQDVASKANFTVYATDGSPRGTETAFSKTIGKTSSGKTVVLSGGPYWGYVQDGYRPLGINYDFTGETYCSLLASCITLK